MLRKAVWKLTPEKPMVPPTLSIAEITLKDGEVRLQYQVMNPREGDRVFLRNLHQDRWKQLTPPPRSNYSAQVAPACYRQEERTVLFMAGTVPRRGNMMVTSFAPIVPLAMPVARGETFEATIRATYPITEWSPYYQPARTGVQETEVLKVQVVLEYLFEKELDEPADPDPEEPGAFSVLGPTAFLTADATAPSPLQVLVRSDTFMRFGAMPAAPPPA